MRIKANILTIILIITTVFFLIACNKDKEEKVEMITKNKQEVANSIKKTDELDTNSKINVENNNFIEIFYFTKDNYEYEIELNVADYVKGYVQFNKNGIFLTVFEEDSNAEPENFQTYDLVNEYKKSLYENTANYKVTGNKAYRINFNDGDFGIAFLVKNEDEVRLAVIRFGNNESTMHPIYYTEAIKFYYGSNSTVRPGDNFELITDITVSNGIDIIITYSDGRKEKWRVTRAGNVKYETEYYEFFLDKIN